MTKSLAVPIRFFKAVALTVSIFATAGQAQPLPTQSPLTDEDLAFVQKSKELADKASAMETPDWLRTDTRRFTEAHKEARELVAQLQQTDPTMKRMSDLKMAKQRFSNQRTLIFVSHSLGEQGLDDVLEAASKNPDTLVVFRGIPAQANLGEAVLDIQQMAAERDPVPNIVINPVLFTEYNVTSVPTIVVRTGQSTLPGELPEELARVSGLSNPAWIERQIESGRGGDFGARGPVAEISEPDLIELMKQRFAQIDWEEKKEAAIRNFWEQQSFRELPEAHKDRVREIDPTVYIAEDITAPDGTVIAKQGDLINPLDVAPFTQAVVVLDPLDEDQVVRVKDALPEIGKIPGVTRVTYIVTRLDREKGWDSYRSVTDAFDAPVFLLTPDVAQRFELEYVPSIITAQKGRFVVTELADRRNEP